MITINIGKEIMKAQSRAARCRKWPGKNRSRSLAVIQAEAGDFATSNVIMQLVFWMLGRSIRSASLGNRSRVGLQPDCEAMTTGKYLSINP